jgi:hypothetical protein
VTFRTGSSILLLTGVLACASSPRLHNAQPRLVSDYQGAVSVAPASRRLEATWDIRLTELDAARDSVVFLLNAGFDLAEVTGAGVRSVNSRVEDDLREISIHFDTSRTISARRVIRIRYAGAPKFSTDSINSIGSTWAELALDSFWLPIMSDFAHTLTARIRLKLPADWQVASSGRVTRSSNGVEVNQAVALVDVPFVASPQLQQFGDARVTIFHTGADSTRLAQVQRAATRCADHLDARFGGAYPLPPVSIVLAPRSGPGYARKNFIVITQLRDTASAPLTYFLCHEVSHFWSSGGNASGPENWINEGFAEYVAGREVGVQFGDAAFAKILGNWKSGAEGQPPVWNATLTKRPSERVAYRKAPALLAELEARIGSETMERFLRDVLRDRLGTTTEVLTVLRRDAGEETADWFRRRLAS